MIRLQWIALYVVQALNIPKQNNFPWKNREQPNLINLQGYQEINVALNNILVILASRKNYYKCNVQAQNIFLK